jgi:acyl dehydratase
VIYEFAGHQGCDTARVNDHGLSYFDDYALGSTYECGSVSIDQASIVAFAKEFDPQPFHVDPAAAAAGPYGGLIASGWHTAALVMRLLVENYLAAESSLGSAGLDELRWPHPVRPDDTLRVRATVVESRRSLSKPDRGIVKTVVEATNSGGATVMRATAINFMLVRPDSGA